MELVKCTIIPQINQPIMSVSLNRQSISSEKERERESWSKDFPRISRWKWWVTDCGLEWKDLATWMCCENAQWLTYLHCVGWRFGERFCRNVPYASWFASVSGKLRINLSPNNFATRTHTYIFKTEWKIYRVDVCVDLPPLCDNFVLRGCTPTNVFFPPQTLNRFLCCLYENFITCRWLSKQKWLCLNDISEGSGKRRLNA